MSSTLEEMEVSPSIVELETPSGDFSEDSLANAVDSIIKTQGFSYFAKKLAYDTTIQHLNLSGFKFSNKDIIELAQALLTNKTLQSLDLTNNGIRDTGAAALGKSLEENTTLQSLILTDNHISEEGAIALARSLEVNNTLENLEFPCQLMAGAYPYPNNHKISPRFATKYYIEKKLSYNAKAKKELPAHLERKRQSEQMGSSYSPSTNSTQSLVPPMPLPRSALYTYLKETNTRLWKRDYRDEYTKHMNMIPCETTLAALCQTIENNTCGASFNIFSHDLWREDFSSSKFLVMNLSQPILFITRALEKNFSIQLLSLPQCNLQKGVVEIAKVLAKNKTIRFLDLSKNRIEDASSILDMIEVNQTLEYLDLSENDITEVYRTTEVNPIIDRLAKIISKNGKLQHLLLREIRITHEDLQVLAKALETNTTLQTLELTVNGDFCEIHILTHAKIILDLLERNQRLASKNTNPSKMDMCDKKNDMEFGILDGQGEKVKERGSFVYGPPRYEVIDSIFTNTFNFPLPLSSFYDYLSKLNSISRRINFLPNAPRKLFYKTLTRQKFTPAEQHFMEWYTNNGDFLFISSIIEEQEIQKFRRHYNDMILDLMNEIPKFLKETRKQFATKISSQSFAERLKENTLLKLFIICEIEFEDVSKLADALSKNRTICFIEFSNCTFSTDQFLYLSEKLALNETIEYLDLSENGIKEIDTIITSKDSIMFLTDEKIASYKEKILKLQIQIIKNITLLISNNSRIKHLRYKPNDLKTYSISSRPLTLDLMESLQFSEVHKILVEALKTNTSLQTLELGFESEAIEALLTRNRKLVKKPDDNPFCAPKDKVRYRPSSMPTSANTNALEPLLFSNLGSNARISPLPLTDDVDEDQEMENEASDYNSAGIGLPFKTG